VLTPKSFYQWLISSIPVILT